MSRPNGRIRRVATTRFPSKAIPGVAFLLLLLPTVLHAQTSREITGHVLAAGGAGPIEGAAVAVAGLRVETDSLGRFRAGPVVSGSYRLVVEAFGFESAIRDVVVGDEALAPLTIALRSAPLRLAPVVGIGRAVLVRSIRPSEAAGRDARSLTDFIGAGATGVVVTSSSGQVGAGRQIRIRGPRSLQGGRPLVFVDGIRIGSAYLPGPIGTHQVLDYLDTIQPADVEVIEIIRGPDAMLQYGMEGRDGVIRITTKRGGGNR